MMARGWSGIPRVCGWSGDGMGPQQEAAQACGHSEFLAYNKAGYMFDVGGGVLWRLLGHCLFLFGHHGCGFVVWDGVRSRGRKSRSLLEWIPMHGFGASSAMSALLWSGWLRCALF